MYFAYFPYNSLMRNELGIVVDREKSVNLFLHMRAAGFEAEQMRHLLRRS